MTVTESFLEGRVPTIWRVKITGYFSVKDLSETCDFFAYGLSYTCKVYSILYIDQFLEFGML